MRTRATEKLLQDIVNITRRTYGDSVQLGHTFNVTPRIAQTVETHVQQQNDFLKKINFVGVKEIKGQVLGFGVPNSLLRRTTKSNSQWKKRRPTDPSGLVSREYECNDYESDPLISWDKLDQWVHLPNFYERFRQVVLVAQATDRLRVGWNGQFKATDTDPEVYPLLQDMQQGWIQYLIENAPEQVMGISPDAADPMGYTVDEIRVGPGAGDNGYESLDELVYHIRQSLIHKLFRRKTDMKAILGDELITEENRQLFGAEVAPTERLARNLYLNSQTFGRTDVETSDEFPERGVFVGQLSNFSYYYQKTSLRRKLVDDHNEKGIVDYHYGRDDYPLEVVEACGVVHPDAIHIKNKAGAWVPVAEAWKVEL